jgi:hypothetical protein
VVERDVGGHILVGDSVLGIFFTPTYGSDVYALCQHDALVIFHLSSLRFVTGVRGSSPLPRTDDHQ